MIVRYNPSWGFLIHDPGKGHAGWVTTAMIMNNNMAPPLAWSHLAGYESRRRGSRR